MKYLTSILAINLLCAGAALAQGTIAFNNTSSFLSPPPDRLVRFQSVPGATDGAGVVNLGSSLYKAQLYFAADAANPAASAAVIEAASNFRASTTLNPGTWVGGDRTLVGVAENQTTSLIVRVWDSSLFGDYGAASTGGGVIGQSAPFSYTVPVGGSLPGAYFMQNFQGFFITAVPEPSVIALGILGAAAVILRRRKA
jgi:hypothetical protein